MEGNDSVSEKNLEKIEILIIVSKFKFKYNEPYNTTGKIILEWRILWTRKKNIKSGSYNVFF